MDCGLFAGVSEQFALYVANIHLLVLGFVESSGLLEFFFGVEGVVYVLLLLAKQEFLQHQMRFFWLESLIRA